ncbi:tRNA (adenosine(37)-N6)-dimethylallyltransferase MiaA, partial [Mycolicibacterium sp. CBMA 361]|nr:tRNA (adenosine(37)-N6)-dimethylallyltransferase MiaA [Mycolicibacterium sp. CBMA 361]
MRPIAVVGPTGTGKSALALDLAEQLGGEIVNADAMQLYRGMDIGTAKLTVPERRGIVHHQLDVLDVTDTATVANYQAAAAADIEAIAARGAVPVIVGGSMMYIQSLLDEWSFPATDAQVRARWEDRLAEVGVTALHGELAQVDPEAAASILGTDGRRIVRALEVVELTGQPFAASAPQIGAPRWDTLIVGLDWDTAILDDRLQRRTDLMFSSGLVDEVV